MFLYSPLYTPLTVLVPTPLYYCCVFPAPKKKNQCEQFVQQLNSTNKMKTILNNEILSAKIALKMQQNVFKYDKMKSTYYKMIYYLIICLFIVL